MDGYLTTMRSKGFSPATMKSVRKFRCPECGFEFSIVYARTFACRGCSKAVTGCSKVRCAKCDHEFPIQDTPEIHGRFQEKVMDDHMARIVSDYYADMGWKKSR
jgi:hypothetical protein